jgi:hypothetical protein
MQAPSTPRHARRGAGAHPDEPARARDQDLAQEVGRPHDQRLQLAHDRWARAVRVHQLHILEESRPSRGSIAS